MKTITIQTRHRETIKQIEQTWAKNVASEHLKQLKTATLSFI